MEVVCREPGPPSFGIQMVWVCLVVKMYDVSWNNVRKNVHQICVGYSLAAADSPSRGDVLRVVLWCTEGQSKENNKNQTEYSLWSKDGGSNGAVIGPGVTHGRVKRLGAFQEPTVQGRLIHRGFLLRGWLSRHCDSCLESSMWKSSCVVGSFVESRKDQWEKPVT